MGCDIHAHAEVKINGKWHHYSQPNIGRNYWLFARMAGVRGDATPIAQPRGLPKGITFTTKFDYKRMKSDAHTPSWLSGTEIEQLCEDAEREHKRHSPDWYSFEQHVIGYVFGNGWNVKKYPDDYPKGVQDVRLVFWFDN